MPTVLTHKGIRYMVFVADHHPEHIHVIGRGFEASFWLFCDDDFIMERKNTGFKSSEIKEFLQVCKDNKDLFCNIWEKIHGFSR